MSWVAAIRRRLLKFSLRALTLIGVLLVTISPLVSRQGVVLAAGLLALAMMTGLLLLSHRDSQAILTLMLLFLFLLPENYVLVGPLKSVGNPAQLVGTLALALWLSGRVLDLVPAARAHPVRWSYLAFAMTCMTAFIAAQMRTLAPMEASGVGRSIFPILAMLGIGLLAIDGLETREHVETLLRRLVMIGGVASAIGMLEFFDHGFNYFRFVHLPGLTTNTLIINDTRSGFSRVDGAAAHPIEYSVALATLVPLALHFALHGPTQKARRRSWVAFVLMASVIPMTVSRSGLLAIVVGLLFYGAHLSGRARINALVIGVLGLGLFRAAVPGLLGTLRGLLLIGNKDPSIQGRTQDYARIPALVEHYLWFGRGLGTFQPLQYFYLDNQYLGSLLEGGIVEVGALIGLFVVGVCVARGIRHRAPDDEMRGLGQALAGSIAALCLSAGTFDLLSFRQTGFLVFLLTGCAGALWTSVRHQPRRSARREADRPSAPVAESQKVTV